MVKNMHDWCVAFQLFNAEYSGGDFQPLVDLVTYGINK